MTKTTLRETIICMAIGVTYATAIFQLPPLWQIIAQFTFTACAFGYFYWLIRKVRKLHQQAGEELDRLGALLKTIAEHEARERGGPMVQ